MDQWFVPLASSTHAPPCLPHEDKKPSWILFWHMQVVQDYNADPDVHGILVQLPLPKHINEQTILDAVSYEKDVDGFHPQNIGCLAMRTRQPLFVCCTPKVHIHCLCANWHYGVFRLQLLLKF